MIFQILSSPILRQYAVVIIMNLTVLGLGLGLAWPSPMLVKLRNSTETVLEQPITEEQGSWVVSFGFLVGAMTSFLPVLLLDRIGRKYTLLMGTLPRVVGASFLTFATQVWMLIVGRTLCAVSDMFLFSVVPIYASELASKEVRGALGTILQIVCSLGVVTMLTVGPFASYLFTNALVLVVVLVGTFSVMTLPESPYFLYARGRTEECYKTLLFLKGNEAAAREGLKEFETTETEEKVNKLQLFKDKLFWKVLIITTVIASGSQIIGFNAVTFYLQTILESTQTSVKPEIASVIIGLIQITASLCTTGVTDRFGRKPILIVTLIGMMFGMIGLGVFFFIKDGSGVISGFVNFLPLMSLILVVFCYSAGPGSVNWALCAELFDNAGRSVGCPIAGVLSTLVLFLTTKYFAFLTLNIGAAYTYWGFSFMCFAYCIFIAVCVPETKGKSFAEIQEALGSKAYSDSKNTEKPEV